MTTQNKDNRSASQKIQDLENALMSLYQTADNMARDLGTIKDAIRLLGNKVDSIVKASSNGEAINDSVISRIMIENNVEELTQKVAVLVAQGSLAPQEQVDESSFIVGSEVNDEGAVINPRLQFAFGAVRPELREKLKGGKVGDTLILEEGKLKFKVLEVYAIQMPKAPEEADVSAEPAPVEAAPESAPAPAEAPAAAGNA